MRAAALRRRREAALRLPPMHNGHRDPLDARAARNAPQVAARLVGTALMVAACPYCDGRHRHGAGGGYGLRLAHCGGGSYVLVAAGGER